jgi:hypothetical protein
MSFVTGYRYSYTFSTPGSAFARLVLCTLRLGSNAFCWAYVLPRVGLYNNLNTGCTENIGWTAELIFVRI